MGGAPGAGGARDGARQRGGRGGERGAARAQPVEQRGRLVAAVAAVRLVGALAGEHDLDPLGREARQLREGGGGGDAAGLLEARHRGGQLGEEVGLDHRGVVVVGADQAGALGGRAALVEQAAVAGEADRERARRLRRALGHGGHDGGRVDAAARGRRRRGRRTSSGARRRR